MPVLVPSLILSIFAVCVTGVRADIYTRRHWDKQILTWQHWVEQILELDVGYVKTNIALTWMLLFINILLLVFSILGTEIALEVLLSLANGVLILYQCLCASIFPLGQEFCDDHKNLVRLQIFAVLAASVLSPVVPYVWKEADKVSHLAGLIFFAVEYLMLFWFYVYGCRGEYLKPILPQGLARDILLSNIGLSTIAFLSAIPSATYYGKGEIDFKSSLWIKYTVAELWLLWLVLYSQRFFKALWFWRWNADSVIASVATDEPLGEGSVVFQFSATDANSKTPSLAKNETPCVGLNLTLPPPVYQDIRNHPFEPSPNNIKRNSSEGAGDMQSVSLSNAATHEGWESPGETAGRRPSCPPTATAYVQRWGQRGSMQRDASNMKTKTPRKRIHYSDTDTVGRGAAPKLAGNDTDRGTRHYLQCNCFLWNDDSDNSSAPCPRCGHLCCLTNIPPRHSSE